MDSITMHHQNRPKLTHDKAYLYLFKKIINFLYKLIVKKIRKINDSNSYFIFMSYPFYSC